jgi:Tfp pilus assembly protein PilF
VRYFQKGLTFKPNDAAALTNLGWIVLEQGKASVAAEYFSRALSCDSASNSARQGLEQARGARAGQ